MKLLIVNPILYTSETANIKRAETIKDTMIYDLCLGFMKSGIDVTLAAAENFKPRKEEEYPFKVVWLDTKLTKLFPPHTLPYCPGIKKCITENDFDLIITSEVFSLNSLMLSVRCRKKLIVWHELAKHNRLMREIPSKIWYNIVARFFFKNTLIVARSIEAKNFISQFCNTVCDRVIDHGVNLDKFTFRKDKENYFAVSSQLIKRKRIHKTLECFAAYIKKYDSACRLYIMGEGEEKENLESLAKERNISDSVIFTGKLDHGKLIEILGKAKAMLVYTQKDNNMVSIVESIALGTPVITTEVPYNASYIKAEGLGIAKNNWNEDDMNTVSSDDSYIKNCLNYRVKLSTEKKAADFLSIAEEQFNIQK